MAGLGAKDILRNITALEQLIEEINFQRAKEMRQCLMSKDSDTSFVIVHGTTYWTDLFVRHFLFQTDRSTDADDLLFFIRKKQVRGSRYIPKYQTEVEVYRKDSRKLPIGDPDIDWEETVYLNLIIHQFDYTLTLAVCTRTSPKELQVLKRHSQKVYASPSRRRMDSKGEVEEMTYPNVCFHVDNFDEVFGDMLVRDGEMVCVELVAADHGGTRQAVIFLGSIRYDALKRVYDTRASLSSKVAQRMMLGLFSGGAPQRIEFVRMKGPQGKGHAEMAVTKPKGSGVETPTSEPGISLTDLWDSDWEDEPEDRFFYRHQRRLSDPSANFNTFINSGWVSKAEGKSRSENEGLDNFSNGLYEIESGDVRDALCSCRCCSIVACRKSEMEETIQWKSQGICEICRHFHGEHLLSSYCLNIQNSINEEKFCVEQKCLSHRSHSTKSLFCERSKDYEQAYEAIDPTESIENMELYSLKSDLKGRTKSLELPPKNSFSSRDVDVLKQDSKYFKLRKHQKASYIKCKKKSPEKSYSLKKKCEAPGSAVRIHNSPKSYSDDSHCKEYIPLFGAEECCVQNQPPSSSGITKTSQKSFEVFVTSVANKSLLSGPVYYQSAFADQIMLQSICNTGLLRKLRKSISVDNLDNVKKCRRKKIVIPFKVTRDGTKVFFPCDIKLDDGAYNPLWTTKGFTQTFHFWKESRRAQSIPLNAYLTYVALPWFTIITDILDHRTGPILTF